jgi:hypothetical protein
VTRDRRAATRARRLALLVAAAGLAACGGGGRGDQEPVPEPTLPLPTAGIAGQPVAVYPLTLITAEERLGWQDQLADRHATLARADSIIGALLEYLDRFNSRFVGLTGSDEQLALARAAYGVLAATPESNHEHTDVIQVALSGTRIAVLRKYG